MLRKATAIKPSEPDIQYSGLPFVRLRSLPEQVADGIVEGIAAGMLKPGQRLIEAEISSQTGVSRVPVREALKILDIQGIVQCIPHRGVRVVDIDERRIAQVREVRVALEKIAVREAAATIATDPEPLARLDAIIDRMADLGEKEDWSALNQADIAFHRELCVASNNQVVLTLWEGLARNIRIIFAVESHGLDDAGLIPEEHRELRAALLRGGGASLDRVIDNHIRGRKPRRRSRHRDET